MANPWFLRNGAEINSLVSQIKEAYADKKAVIDGLNIMNLYIYIFLSFCISLVLCMLMFCSFFNISFCIVLGLAFCTFFKI